jgi:hypothetical protein
MPLDNGEEAFDVVAEFLGRNRRVLDKRQRLRIVLHRHRQTEAGFAKAPDAGLAGWVERVVIGVAKLVLAQVALERGQSRREIVGAVGVELDAEQRSWIALDEALSQCLEHGTLTRVIEDGLIHHLDGRWPVTKNQRCRGE